MRLNSAELIGNRINVIWSDGVVEEFPTVWLLHACTCAECGLSIKGVRNLKLTDFQRRPRPHNAWVSEEKLWIDWGSEHKSVYQGNWLRGHRLSAEGRSERNPRQNIWGKDLTIPEPMSYLKVCRDESAHQLMLERIRDLGFVIISDVPVDASFTEKISSLIGVRRITNYDIYELKSKKIQEQSGDMAVELVPHTDEMYRIDPPAITLFHVMAQSKIGGDSTLVDGLRLAQRMEIEHPDELQTLCKIPARFHRELEEGRHFDLQAPIFRRDEEGMITGIRLNDRCMAPVDADPDNSELFYDALRPLMKMIYSAEETITFKLKTGEMLIFNNHRLLHGRTGFDPSSGRHVRLVHVDLDEFHSRLRVSLRRSNSPDEWMRLGPGATA